MSSSSGGEAAGDVLLKMGRFFRKGEVSADSRALFKIGGREADSFYRERWAHDKVVRSTHGVNCTGSCSWKVYVKDGIITWEAQQIVMNAVYQATKTYAIGLMLLSDLALPG